MKTESTSHTTSATGADDLVEQQNADAQDALQAALDAHRTLRRAEAALVTARAAYNAACAKLAPFQRLTRVAA